MSVDETQPFYVHQTEGAYHVHQRSSMAQDDERVIMKCRDQGSAKHYAALLNAAHKSGYKAGYRAARRIDRDAD